MLTARVDGSRNYLLLNSLRTTLARIFRAINIVRIHVAIGQQLGAK